MVLLNKNAYPKFCLQLLSDIREKWPPHLTYHTLDHIVDVANVCDDYIRHYRIDKEDAKLIRIAAIGHDLGYMTSPENHEEQSIIALSRFLEKKLNEQQIEKVNGLIRATKVPQKPIDLHQEILADADLDYLGRDDYALLSEKLYQEFLHYGVLKNRADWLEVQIDFLENHSYHTSYANENRTETKLKNLQELKQKRQ
jgi:predicted metal-dependent HD superfamily phosphohydrolase